MLAPCQISPNIQIAVEPFGNEGHKVIIIDNVLDRADLVVDHVSSSVAFRPVAQGQNFYPGIRAPAPREYALPVSCLVRSLAERHLGIDTSRMIGARSAFAMATIPPEKLTLTQSQPHFDTVDPLQLATVHYLCAARHGGTAFYRHRATGFEEIHQARAAIFQQQLADELKHEQADMQGRYIVEENALFEQTQRVEAQFDRMIIYKSNLLHSGLVNANELSTDPLRGRLTATTFMKFA